MLTVEAHADLTNPVRFPASRVLILDENGTPLAFAVTMRPGHHRVFRVGDPDFNEQLQTHGISRSVVVTKLDPKTLAKV